MVGLLPKWVVCTPNYHFLGPWALQSPACAKCYFYPFSILCLWHVPPSFSSVYYTARHY